MTLICVGTFDHEILIKEAVDRKSHGRRSPKKRTDRQLKWGKNYLHFLHYYITIFFEKK